MSSWLVGLMGLTYLVVAIDQFFKGATGQGIMFLGYAIGNVGILLVVK
jgi:hypothetical protein